MKKKGGEKAVEYSIGDVLRINGSEFNVIGKITYRNTVDGKCWDEYRLISVVGKSEAWLSVDDVYKEYSLSYVVMSANLNGFHEVDRGVEVVVSARGNVDVDGGDTATFSEFEDQAEERIISQEIWDDGAEYSEGFYIDPQDIVFVKNDPKVTFFSGRSSSGGAVTKGKTIGTVIMVLLIIGVFSLPIAVPVISSLMYNKSISSYLNESGKYTYSTSITGKESQKADVYEAMAGESVDSVTRDIIDGIKGKTDYVQEDSEDVGASVAILTADEYCMIYLSSDGKVLVQVSNRKYAYTSDKDLYHGTSRSRRYYRRFYYSNGYNSDSSRYSGYSSPYSSFSDSTISYNSGDTYNSYSSSIRQSSIFSRSSSGGGISSGK